MEAAPGSQGTFLHRLYLADGRVWWFYLGGMIAVHSAPGQVATFTERLLLGAG